MRNLCKSITTAVVTGALTSSAGALLATIYAGIGAQVLANSNNPSFRNGPDQNKVLSAIQVAAAGSALVKGIVGAFCGFFYSGQDIAQRLNPCMRIAIAVALFFLLIIEDMIGYGCLTGGRSRELALRDHIASVLTGVGVLFATGVGLTLCCICLVCCCSSRSTPNNDILSLQAEEKRLRRQIPPLRELAQDGDHSVAELQSLEQGMQISAANSDMDSALSEETEGADRVPQLSLS